MANALLGYFVEIIINYVLFCTVIFGNKTINVPMVTQHGVIVTCLDLASEVQDSKWADKLTDHSSWLLTH